MPSRLLVLTIPSAVILAALVWHSLRVLPRRRAVTFWVAVIVYGFIRGIAVHRIIDAIGASFPYEIHDPMLAIAGVSAQEIAGWAVVSYLAWWIGYRFSLRARRPFLFLQIAWAALFLGAISWVVEAAAIAARWWHWTVPTASRVFLNVPAIGIVDWFFVAVDFLLPFTAITAPALAGRRSRFLTLLIFPLHFGAHLSMQWLHVVHWLLVLIVVWLALRSNVADLAFETGTADRRSDVIPSAAFALIVLDVAIVELFLVRRPELLQSIAPALVIWFGAIRPAIAAVAATIAMFGAVKLPSLLVASVVAVGGATLLWLRRGSTVVRAGVTALLLATFAFGFHRHTAAARVEMTGRLDRAISERNRGNLGTARNQLEAIARDHPTSHVAFALAGEIDYRIDRLDAARAKFARAVDIKQDFVRGYRLLAVIDLRRGRPDEAWQWALRGLEVAPNDLQLRYLAGRAGGQDVGAILADTGSAETAAGMASLAFEVGDTPAARRFVQGAMLRWPDDPRLAMLALRLAAAEKDQGLQMPAEPVEPPRSSHGRFD